MNAFNSSKAKEINYGQINPEEFQDKTLDSELICKSKYKLITLFMG